MENFGSRFGSAQDTSVERAYSGPECCPSVEWTLVGWLSAERSRAVPDLQNAAEKPAVLVEYLFCSLGGTHLRVPVLWARCLIVFQGSPACCVRSRPKALANTFGRAG